MLLKSHFIEIVLGHFVVTQSRRSFSNSAIVKKFPLIFILQLVVWFLWGNFGRPFIDLKKISLNS